MESKNESALMLSQPPQVSNTLKGMPAALTCTKNINDCPEAALNFKVYAGAIIYIFCAIAYPSTLTAAWIFFFQLKRKNHVLL
jgi:hypothetical protein